MPVKKKDTERALLLLEEYCSKLQNPDEAQLRQAIEKVICMFKSNLFNALIGQPSLIRELVVEKNIYPELQNDLLADTDVPDIDYLFYDAGMTGSE